MFSKNKFLRLLWKKYRLVAVSSCDIFSRSIIPASGESIVVSKKAPAVCSVFCKIIFTYEPFFYGKFYASYIAVCAELIEKCCRIPLKGSYPVPCLKAHLRGRLYIPLCFDRLLPSVFADSPLGYIYNPKQRQDFP